MDARPIIPWIGGKRRLAKVILPMFPAHTCYVEPFAGAAALFFMKLPAKVEVLNDVNGELVNLYRVVQHHLEEFVRQYKWALVSRKMYEWAQMAVPDTLTDVQRAARFYYLQRLSFGGKVVGQTFGTTTSTPPKLNLLRIEEDLSTAHLRLASAIIEQLDWRDCVKRYDRAHAFFYMDPPYWKTEGYGVDFPLDAYKEMALILRALKGRALVSVNDHPDMRAAFKGLPMQRVDIAYTISGGDHRVKRHELVVRSWK